MRHDTNRNDGPEQTNEPMTDCIPYCGPRTVKFASCLVSGPLFEELELDAVGHALTSVCSELLIAQPSHFLVSIAIQVIVSPDSVVATHIVKEVTADPGALRLL